MSTWLHGVAAFLTVLSVCCFYLTQPAQRWRARPLPQGLGVLLASACLAVAVYLWLPLLSFWPALITACLGWMLTAILLPWLTLWVIQMSSPNRGGNHES